MKQTLFLQTKCNCCTHTCFSLVPCQQWCSKDAEVAWADSYRLWTPYTEVSSEASGPLREFSSLSGFLSLESTDKTYPFATGTSSGALGWDSTFTVGIPTVKVESHLKDWGMRAGMFWLL